MSDSQIPLGPKPSDPPISSVGRRGSSGLWLLLLTVVLFAVFGAGFAVGHFTAHGTSKPKPHSRPAAGPFTAATGPSPAPIARTFHRSDFNLKIKLLDKQCFGSAGCNIEYEVEAVYLGERNDLDGVRLDITYRVTGDDSGAQIGTISLDNGRYDMEQRSASTSSEGVQLAAHIATVSSY